MLGVIATHPVQYHAPVYRYLQQNLGIPTTVIYASDFSVAGYVDPGFGKKFSWDTDLLSGYNSVFLSRVSNGGAKNDAEVSANGIRQALRDVKPSVILVTGYRLRFDMRAYFAALELRVPLLFRAEVIDSTVAKRGFIKRAARDAFLRQFYRSFDKILYIGESALRHYKRLGVKESQLVFSPYCVDTTPFQLDQQVLRALRTSTRAKLDIGQNDFVILLSGKLIPRKAPDFVLSSLKLLSPDTRDKLVVLFLGDGEMREYLQALAETEPQIRVQFIGFQNQTQLTSYYAAADVMVLASQYEPWGLVVNEALHHGLPCVVSDQVGCAPDLVQEGVTGYVFRTGQSEEFNAALVKAMSLAKQPHTMSTCQQLAERYSVEAAARGIASAYQLCEQRVKY